MLVVGTLPSIAAHAQAPPAKAKAAPPAANAAVPPAPPNFDQIIATINGDRITRGDLINFLSRYPIPPGDREQVYRDAVETLINTRLIGQFLSRMKIPLPPGKVEAAIEQLGSKRPQTDGRDLQTALQESRLTMADLGKPCEYIDRITWVGIPQPQKRPTPS